MIAQIESILYPFVVKFNEYLSNYILVTLLVGVGLWYTIKTRFVQIRCFKEGLCNAFGSFSFFGEKNENSVSPFQALTTAIATQVGTGDNVVRVEFTDGPYKNFPHSERITVQAEGHTQGNCVGILEDSGTYYMFHGDVTYCDAALQADALSIIFEDKEKARETLTRVREFIQNNPTVYCSTHCPEGYENLEQKKIMKL